MSRSALSAAGAVALGGLLAWLPTGCAPPNLEAPSVVDPQPADGTPKRSAIPTSVPEDTGWEPFGDGSGLELRTMAVRDEARLLVERMLIVRLDPDRVRFDVGYSPGAPTDIAAWREATGAVLVVNGGFFTDTYDATGLVVSQGTPHGASYGAFAGMFAVTEAGAEVRWLGARPYDPAEPLVAALQAFPMLVLPSGQPGVAEGDASAETARRTWVGQDRQGRVLVGVAPSGGLSLSALSAWLVAADLDLDRALNLDGGGSTGLALAAAPDAALTIPAFDRLPSVILAFPR